MKNAGICPKCGGKELLLVKGYAACNAIPAGWTSGKIDHYLCCGCGYSEEWIDKKEIAKLKEEMKSPSADFIFAYQKQEESL